MGYSTGNRYTNTIRAKAHILRRQGKSVAEISELLGISQSTSSLWVRKTPLSKGERARLITRMKKRQAVGREKVIAHKRRERLARETQLQTNAKHTIRSAGLGKKHAQILCAVFFWCEGGKSTRDGVRFTNSDPNMVRTFLHLLRQSFELQEDRFRALVHVHEYHDDAQQVRFWSKISAIPRSRFYRSYRKPNSGLRIHPNYQGCVEIRYADSYLARYLTMLYQEMSKQYKGA